MKIDEIFGKGISEKLLNKTLESNFLDDIRKYTNPNKEEAGHFTGRCMNCHSNDLWDDATWYGCNFCDSMYSISNITPRIIKTP